MQKKLIALAVASLAWAPFAAQAADVEIGGVMDLGVQMSETETGGVTSKTKTAGIHNGASTSSFKVTVTEDLGGGMKFKGYMETDPALGTNAGAAFANSPNWLQLSGNFGAVTLGFMNNYALSASSASQPFGTGLASGYNGSWGRLDGAQVLGPVEARITGSNAGVGARDIRKNRTLQYEMPRMGGFSAGIIYGFKNDDAAAQSDAAIGQIQIGASFSAGPLNVALAHSTLEQQANFTGTTSNELTHTMIGANYKLGSITIYGGYTMSEASNKADVDSTSMNVAAMFQLNPQLGLGVNYVKVTDDTARVQDRDLIGFGLNYAMSKRTLAYVRYQSGDKLDATANSGDYSDIAVGISHSF
jgi:predicted porin